LLTQRGQVNGQVASQAQGGGVVFAQDTAGAGQGVLVKVPGLLVLTRRGQVNGGVGSPAQGIRVVWAEHPCPIEHDTLKGCLDP